MHAIGGGKYCKVWGAEGRIFHQLSDWGRPVPQKQGGYSQPPQQMEGVQEKLPVTMNTTTVQDEVAFVKKDANRDDKNGKRVNVAGE